MATTALTFLALSDPVDVTTPETANIQFSLDAGPSTVRFDVVAVPLPLGSGPAVPVGSTGGFSGAGTYFESVTLDVSSLDPNTNYTFTVTSSDGSADSIQNVDITCLAEGTLIATARGEVAVEALRTGDLVVNMHRGGALQPIRWIGHTRVDVTRHPDRAKAAPILITAGALGDGAPHRDLRVSPEHAMFLDGHLVPARLLVNGSTIVQEVWRAEVTYWHVELDAHGLLVSDGAVSESYFDDGNRQNFDNHAVSALVKDFESHRANGRYRDAACVPVLKDGLALDRIRARLSAVAARERQSA